MQFWDQTTAGLDLQSVYTTGYITLAVSAAAAVGVSLL